MTALLQILQHSHGLDKFGRGTFYRNHFVTGEGSVDHPFCMEAVRLGLMVRHAGNALTSEMDAFTVTDQGRSYIAAYSPKVARKQRNRSTMPAQIVPVDDRNVAAATLRSRPCRHAMAYDSVRVRPEAT